MTSSRCYGNTDQHSSDKFTTDKFIYTNLTATTAYTITATLTNQFQLTELITPCADKQFSLHSEDDFHSGFLSLPAGSRMLQH